MLKNLLSFSDEETSNFLHSCVLFKQVCVLELCSMLRVVPHQVLSQEDAWVEPVTDARVNFVYTHV